LLRRIAAADSLPTVKEKPQRGEILDGKHTFHPAGAWLCLYCVATTISLLRGCDPSGLTVGGEPPTAVELINTASSQNAPLSIHSNAHRLHENKLLCDMPRPFLLPVAYHFSFQIAA
jgi:hypothetical protein